MPVHQLWHPVIDGVHLDDRVCEGSEELFPRAHRLGDQSTGPPKGPAIVPPTPPVLWVGVSDGQPEGNLSQLQLEQVVVHKRRVVGRKDLEELPRCNVVPFGAEKSVHNEARVQRDQVRDRAVRCLEGEDVPGKWRSAKGSHASVANRLHRIRLRGVYPRGRSFHDSPLCLGPGDLALDRSHAVAIGKASR